MECLSIDRNKLEEMDRIISDFDLEITYTPLGKKCTPGHRKLVYMTGLMPLTDPRQVPATSGDFIFADYCAYSTTLSNTIESWVERVHTVVRGGVRQLVPDSMPGVFNALDPLVSQLVANLRDHTLMTMREFVEKTPAHQRAAYRLAEQNILKYGTHKEWSDIKSFVKLQREDFDGAPRAINPCHFEWIILLGRFVASIEHKCGGEHTLFEAIDELWYAKGVEYRVCSKGLNNTQWAEVLYQKWNKFPNPVYKSFDCSRFSQSAGKAALQMVIRVIVGVFPEAEPWFRKAASGRKSSSRVSDGEGMMWACSTNMPPMLCDGERWTAAVGHIVMCLVQLQEVPFSKFNYCPEPIDCGDDFGLIMDASDLVNLDEKSLVRRCASYGLTLKIENRVATTLINEVLFCKMSPLLINGEPRLIRPPYCLQKDAMYFCEMRDVNDRMFAVGMGGSALNIGVPVYHNFYRCLVRLSGKNPKSFGKRQMAYLYGHDYSRWEWLIASTPGSRHVVPVSYSDQDRFEFYKTTGIPPSSQQALEEFYDNVQVTNDTSPTLWQTFW